MVSDGEEGDVMEDITWDDVLQMDLVGRYLILQEIQGSTTCGPIDNVEDNEGFITFERRWVARKVGGNEWRLTESDPEMRKVGVSSRHQSAQPWLRDGTLYFNIYFIGSSEILPVGQKIMVEGLKAGD